MKTVSISYLIIAALVAVCLSCTVHAATNNNENDKVNVSVNPNGALDGPTLAYDLTRTFMTQEKWKEEVAKVRAKYEDWERDTRGDMGQYLNDRIICVALGAAGGEVDKIQKGIMWLAFYKEFNQEAHPQVLKFLREHRGTMMNLLSAFSWDRASQYVKTKEWRKDLEDKKTPEKVEAAPIRTEAVAVKREPPVAPKTVVQAAPIKPAAPAPVQAPKAPAKPAPLLFPWLDRAATVYSTPGVNEPKAVSFELIPLSNR